MKKLTALFLFVVFTLSGCSGSREDSMVTNENFIMNTTVSQRVYGKNAEKAIQSVNERLTDLEQSLSMFIDGSDVSKINKQAGLKPVKVNDYTFDLIKKSIEYSSMTDGMFDITVAPLTKLWDIGGENPRLPENSEITQALSLVDYKNVELDEEKKTVFLKQPGMSLDLGGVAKGYFCAEIMRIYSENSVKSAFCSIGGNIFTFGRKPDGKQFKLGIANPNSNSNTDLFATLNSDDGFVTATSGGYERYLDVDGVRYTHILSTKTGYPAETDIKSATVISKDGGLADFLSTALYMAGTSQIDKYLNSSDFSVIIVDNNNNVYASDNIKDEFKIIDDNFTLR